MNNLLNNEQKNLNDRLQAIDGAINECNLEFEKLQQRLNNLHQERERIIGGLETIQNLQNKSE